MGTYDGRFNFLYFTDVKKCLINCSGDMMQSTNNGLDGLESGLFSNTQIVSCSSSFSFADAFQCLLSKAGMVNRNRIGKFS